MYTRLTLESMTNKRFYKLAQLTFSFGENPPSGFTYSQSDFILKKTLFIELRGPQNEWKCQKLNFFTNHHTFYSTHTVKYVRK